MIPYRSKAYLAFVRSHPCIVTDTELDVVAHHCRHAPHGGGTSIKPSDYRTVPLSPLEHARLHHVGEKSFWKSVKIHPEFVMIDMLSEWIHIHHRVYIPKINSLSEAIQLLNRIENFLAKPEGDL